MSRGRGEMRKLTLSPINSLDDSNVLNPLKSKDQDKSANLPITPTKLGYSKVNYLNEKKTDQKKNDKNSSGNTNKKDVSSGLFGRASRSRRQFAQSPPQRPPPPARRQDPFEFPSPGQCGNATAPKEALLAGESRTERHRAAASGGRRLERETQHHMFSADAADVDHVEKKLLQLMDDFETGKLKAFGKDSRLRQMEEIREQQEKLAKLHFDVGVEQDLSEEGLRISGDSMKTLMEKLAQLSESIENLQTNTCSSSQHHYPTSTSERKHNTPPPPPPHRPETTQSTQPSFSHKSPPVVAPPRTRDKEGNIFAFGKLNSPTSDGNTNPAFPMKVMGNAELANKYKKHTS